MEELGDTVSSRQAPVLRFNILFCFVFLFFDDKYNLKRAKYIEWNVQQSTTTSTTHNPITSMFAFSNLCAWAQLWVVQMVNKLQDSVESMI